MKYPRPRLKREHTRPNVPLGTGRQANDYPQKIIIGLSGFNGCFSLAKN